MPVAVDGARGKHPVSCCTEMACDLHRSDKQGGALPRNRNRARKARLVRTRGQALAEERRMSLYKLGMQYLLAGMLACGVVTAAVAAAHAVAAPASDRMYRVSVIVGSDVRDARALRIGEVKDLIVGSRRGDIAYAVLAFDRAAAGGRRYHAVPWQALRASDDGSYYILPADRETIARAPGFDPAQWPDLNDSRWRTEVDAYWAERVGKGTAEVNRMSSGVSGSNSAASPADGK